jgi:hypothetical protein
MRLLTQRPWHGSSTTNTSNLRMQWREARRTLDWWTRQSGGSHFCLALLDCMIQQAQQQSQYQSSAGVGTNSNNNLRDLPWRAIVQRWAMDWTQQQQASSSSSSSHNSIDHINNTSSSIILTPAEFSTKLDQYRHILGHLSSMSASDDDYNNNHGTSSTSTTRIVLDPSLFEMIQKTAAAAAQQQQHFRKKAAELKKHDDTMPFLTASYVYQRLLSADGAKDPDACPDSYTINTMLRRECKKSTSPSSSAATAAASTTAAWAQGVLHLMWTLFRNHGWHHVRPDHHTYTSVLTACLLEIKDSRDNNYESSFHGHHHHTNDGSRSRRMLELLEEMQQHSTIHSGLGPGPNHYMMVLSACAVEGKSDTARLLFDNMHDHYQATRRDALKPTGKLCTAFCSAIAAANKSSCPHDNKNNDKNAHRAAIGHVEDILNQMMQRYNVDGDSIWLPTEQFWTSYLSLLTHSGDLESIEKAETVLLNNSKMTKDQGMMMHFRPNRFHYGPVIRGWAQAGQPERAQALLELMYNQFLQTGHAALKPDAKVFLDVMTAWKDSDCSHAQERAAQLVEFMSRLHMESSSSSSWLSWLLSLVNESTLSTEDAVQDHHKSNRHGNHTTGTPMDLLKMLSTVQYHVAVRSREHQHQTGTSSL